MIEVHNKNILIERSKEDLILKYLEECYSNKPGNRTKRKEKFVTKYNRGHWEAVFKVLGKITYATLERWKKKYLDSKGDRTAFRSRYKKTSSSESVLKEVLIQIRIDTDKTEFGDLQKEAINYIKAGRIKIFSLKDIQ